MTGLPNDATGDALRRFRNDGADSSKLHEIDFHVAVLSEEAGQYVGDAARQLGFQARVVKDNPGPNWTGWCTKQMVLDHTAFTEVEVELDRIAWPVGGYSDGWVHSA